jgi:hypothetical protein
MENHDRAYRFMGEFWFGLVIWMASIQSPTRADEWTGQFLNPPSSAGMAVYWIWFGPAITNEGIDRDLANMKSAHIAGVTILPVYPLAVNDELKGIRNLRFLSGEFLDRIAYAARRCKELGLMLDLTPGTGWPYGGPWISPELSGRMIRLRKTSQPPVANEELIARFGDQVVISIPTNMRVKRPALGGEGLVVDPFNPHSIARHLEAAGTPLWQAARNAGFRAVWCDSLEIYSANWTADFPNQFKSRRGYDLKPYLPLLFGEATSQSRQVRHDYWQTLSESAADSFFKPLRQWSHDHNVALRAEPYGQPPVSLGSFRYVDLPVGEHYEWKAFNATRWSAAGGHLFGKNLIDAEAWTWLGLPNRFADSLEQIKLASDMHFVSGANSLMGISYVHAPLGAERTYWLSYWGPFLNEHQPWWPYFPLLSRYIQRTSWVLRQGKPVSEVGLYLPIDDVFAETPADSGLNLYFGVREKLHGGAIPEFSLQNAMAANTRVVSTLINNGYGFDALDSATMPSAKVERGRLSMGLSDFSLVVLPNLTGMPLADLQKLADFVRGGGVVVATRRLPEIAYGFTSTREDTPKMARLIGEMFAGAGYGRGKAVLVEDEGEAFRSAMLRLLKPDLKLLEADPAIASVHRRLCDQDFYFVANFSAEEKTLPVQFKAKGKGIQTWDPMTGLVSSEWDDRVHLRPYGSAIIRVTRDAVLRARKPRSCREQAIPITGPWQLKVVGHASVEMKQLRPWTALDDLLHFSGSGTYATTFKAEPYGSPARVMLDLGEVREIAEVRLNDKNAGVAWMRPYRLDVTKFLQPGQNKLEVRVTNLLINEALGKPEPDYRAVHKTFGERFPTPGEWKECRSLPSGLIGPVMIRMEVELK